MTTLSLRCEHAGFDNASKVNRFRELVHNLVENITDKEFMSLIVQSKDKLGNDYERIVNQRDIPGYFDVLEKNYSEENLVQFLMNLFECANLHDDEGKFSDRIRQYQLEKEEYLRECAARGICKDPNFVGREETLSEAMECLGPNSKYKGIILGGQGGIGKTTLAKEICYRLKYQMKSLQLHTVDLREKCDMTQLYTGLLASMDENFVSIQNQEEIELKIHFMETVKTAFSKNAVVFLDNADGIVQNDPKQFADFVSAMDRMGTECRTKLLITTRQKLCSFEEPTRETDERVTGHLKEFELFELRHDDCVKLLTKCSSLSPNTLSDRNCSQICELCDGNPMAIRLIAAMLRDGFKVEEMIAVLRRGDDLVSERQTIATCLKESFMHLDKTLQVVLVKLSLFHTATFDLQAAAAVGGDDDDDDSMEEAEISQKMARKKARDRRRSTMDLKLRRLKQRNLIEFVEYPEEIQEANSKGTTCFSLHPLVWKYVSEVSKEGGIQMKVEEAKKRFVTHFVDVINKYGKEREGDPLKMARMIQGNAVHLRTFFQFILSEIYNLNELRRGRSQREAINQNATVKAISDIVLNPELQTKFFRRQAEQMVKSNDIYGYIYWRCEEADNLMANHPIELAEKALEQVECIAAGLVLTDNVCSEEQTTIEEVQGKFGNTAGEELTPFTVRAIAAYYKVKGKCFHKKKMYDQALVHLKVAESLYGGHCQEVNVFLKAKSGRKIFKKSDFFKDLADVKNTIGTVYFNKRDCKKSLKYHKEACNVKLGSKQLSMDLPIYIGNIASYHHQMAAHSENENERIKELEEARHLYDMSIEYDQILKKEMSLTHVSTLSKRANVIYYQGDPEQALKDAHHSLIIRRQIVIPPNVELTQAIIQVASLHYSVGKKKSKSYANVEANENFKLAQQHFEEAMNAVKNGGMPIHLNNYQDFRDLRAEHLRLMTKDLKMPEQYIATVKERYEEIKRHAQEEDNDNANDDDDDDDDDDEDDEKRDFEELNKNNSSGNRPSYSTSGSSGDSYKSDNAKDQPPPFIEVHQKYSVINHDSNTKKSETADKGTTDDRSTCTSVNKNDEEFPLNENEGNQTEIAGTRKDRLAKDKRESFAAHRNRAVSVSVDQSPSCSSGSGSDESRKRSSRSLQSIGSQSSVTSMMGKLMTLHSRSQDDEVFMLLSDNTEAAEEKRKKKDS